MKWVVAAAFLLPSLAVASAQTPVTGCSRECDSLTLQDGMVRTAGPAWVALYGHMLGMGAVLTTQPILPEEPDLAYRPGLEAGFPIFSSNVYKSFIEWKEGKFRHYGDSGFARNVTVAPDGVAFLYVSADVGDGTMATGISPEVRLESIFTSGRNGPVVGRGMSGPGVVAAVAGDAPVYEFRMPVRFSETEWAGMLAGGRSFGWEVFLVGAPADHLRSQIRVHTGATFPPRVLLETHSPVSLEGLTISPWNGQFFIRTSVMSAFGSYEIQPENVWIEGARPGDPTPSLLIFKRSFSHDAQYEPVNVTWKLPQDPAPAGTMFRVHARNLQGTFEAIATTGTPVLGQGVDLPTTGAFVAMASALAVLFRRRT